MFFPDRRRVEFYGTDTPERLEVEVTHQDDVWIGRALRLSKGRLLRAPGESTTKPLKVEEIVLRADSYNQLFNKFRKFCKVEIGEDISSIDSDHVNDRVQDWKQRIDRLYEWISNGIEHLYEVSAADEVQMNEEMMQKFHLRPTTLPILRVSGVGGMLLFVKPKGLWIVGANGRIDLLTSASTYFFVDVSEYGAASNWVLYDSKRSRPQPFTIDLLKGILGNDRI